MTNESRDEELKKVLERCPQNLIIFDSFVKTDSTVPQFKSVLVAVSGGSDSDIVVDIFKKLFYDIDIHFVWYDTGVEYKATKDHLDFLEDKYGIEIKRVRAIKPIPTSCKEYGQPFLSKYVSEMIMRLQKNNFKFENKPFSDLLNEYCQKATNELEIYLYDEMEKEKDAIKFNLDYKPNYKGYSYIEEAKGWYKGCVVALKWWCNLNGDNSAFNINRNKLLKAFMVKHPPTFKISNQCCQWAKKKVAHKYMKENNIDLNVIGVRKSEGGIRNTAYSTCFDRGEVVSNYRPIFWYRNYEKLVYNEHYKIINSLCYSGYGLSRTGCAGCPFCKDFEEELKIIEVNEPKLYKAVNNIFGESYTYTRAYKQFIKDKEENINQTSLFDFIGGTNE